MDSLNFKLFGLRVVVKYCDRLPNILSFIVKTGLSACASSGLYLKRSIQASSFISSSHVSNLGSCLVEGRLGSVKISYSFDKSFNPSAVCSSAFDG
jgi:hypothetical protein